MLNFVNSQYQQYLNDYFNFLTVDTTKPFYKTRAEFIEDSSALIQIIKYKSLNPLPKQVFLVIPSLFNSPEILFLGKDKSFIDNLLECGDVYLVDWQESSVQRTINEYILELTRVINNIVFIMPKIKLVGHCLGGNIAIGVGCLLKEKIASLTLLTTPWDYSHFNNAINLHKMFGLDKVIENQELVPKIYIQMMFFLLFSDQFSQKIIKYSGLKTSEFKDLYLKVENWLQSGIDIPKSVYLQIIDDLADKNIFHKEEWYLNNEKINLNEIDYPVCIISAKEDRIAPLNSILPLRILLKNSTLIEVKGGHISYLLNSDTTFKNKYHNWLLEN